jgi:hypothetical protein
VRITPNASRVGARETAGRCTHPDLGLPFGRESQFFPVNRYLAALFLGDVNVLSDLTRPMGKARFFQRASEATAAADHHPNRSTPLPHTYQLELASHPRTPIQLAQGRSEPSAPSPPVFPCVSADAGWLTSSLGSAAGWPESVRKGHHAGNEPPRGLKAASAHCCRPPVGLIANFCPA